MSRSAYPEKKSNAHAKTPSQMDSNPSPHLAHKGNGQQGACFSGSLLCGTVAGQDETKRNSVDHLEHVGEDGDHQGAAQVESAQQQVVALEVLHELGTLLLKLLRRGEHVLVQEDAVLGGDLEVL